MTSSAPGIAVQLFAVREQLNRDPEGTLGELASIGFEGVETAFFDRSVDLGSFRRLLERNGLPIAAAHVQLPVTEEVRGFVARQVDELGVSTIIFNGARDEPRATTSAGVDHIVADFADAAKWAEARGLRFGLHHHWWELRRIDGGKLLLESIVDRLPETVFVEPDCYWAALAEVPMCEITAPFAGRMPLHHIKDGPAKDAVAGMTALGGGNVDVPAAIAAAHDAEWWIAELSHCETDMMEALVASFDYLAGARQRDLDRKMTASERNCA
jgi:sugar phosphate isomerase/epimerase